MGEGKYKIKKNKDFVLVVVKKIGLEIDGD